MYKSDKLLLAGIGLLYGMLSFLFMVFFKCTVMVSAIVSVFGGLAIILVILLTAKPKKQPRPNPDHPIWRYIDEHDL